MFGCEESLPSGLRAALNCASVMAAPRAGVLRLLLLSILPSPSLFESPPKEPPSELLSRYTMDGQIPLERFYVDDTAGGEPTHYSFTAADVDGFLQWARLVLGDAQGTHGLRSPRLRGVQKHLVSALHEARPNLDGTKALVFGSMEPWVEALLLTAGCSTVTTVEYNRLTFEHPRLKTVMLQDFDTRDGAYDVAVAVSSFDHDGLGRYGDRLHPDGDVIAMRTAWEALNSSGMLLLGLPVGADLVVWNLHRRYGPLRLPRMLQGWEEMDRFGWDDARGSAAADHRVRHEPVFLLRKQPDEGSLPVVEPLPLTADSQKDEV
jgi:hypothetical protein